MAFNKANSKHFLTQNLTSKWWPSTVTKATISLSSCRRALSRPGRRRWANLANGSNWTCELPRTRDCVWNHSYICEPTLVSEKLKAGKPLKILSDRVLWRHILKGKNSTSIPKNETLTPVRLSLQYPCSSILHSFSNISWPNYSGL